MSTTQQRGKAKDVWPDFNVLNYKLSVSKNLNHYSIEVDDNKRKKEWAIDFWKSQNKNVTGLSRVSEGYFISVGAVAHMIHQRGIDLESNERAYCDKKYAELIELIPPTITPIVIDVKDTADVEFKIHMAEFDAGLDMFFNGKVFDSKSYLLKHQVKGAQTKRIADSLKVTLTEVKEAQAGLCPDLVEGYSFLTKKQLSKFVEYISSMISSCEVAAAITKASRKPRATKVKTPLELTKHVKYMLEDPVNGIKSDHPSKIINALEAWVFNAKTRRLFKYVALKGSKLSIKGTTIINIDPEQSIGKIIRLPKKQLVGVQNFTMRPMQKLFSDIKGTASKATGRLSEDTIIIKCFN